MITRHWRFNLYLALALFALCACQSPEKKRQKQISTLAVHLQTTNDDTPFSRKISVFRNAPAEISVDRSAFLTEAHVAGAKVIDDENGWSLQLKFDQRGTWLLEQYSTANPGKHIAIFSTFGPDQKEARWLGAPILPRRISNGILQFTPDASREEADEIVFGLNNMAKKSAQNSKW